MTHSHAELVELVERLRDEGTRLSSRGYRDSCCSPDCGISANLANEAADALEALLSRSPAREQGAVARDAQLAAMMLDSLIENREVKFHPNGVRDVDHYRELLGVARNALTHPAPAQDEARVRMENALNWLVHLYHGVSKSGDKPTSAEWDQAWADAEAALTPSTKREGG